MKKMRGILDPISVGVMLVIIGGISSYSITHKDNDISTNSNIETNKTVELAAKNTTKAKY